MPSAPIHNLTTASPKEKSRSTPLSPPKSSPAPRETTGYTNVFFCDAGRVVGIIRPRGPVDTSNLVFGGRDRNVLYAAAGSKVYKRILRRQGVAPGQVVKLPRPQF